MGRLAKQLFIGSIYLIILGVLGFGAYDVLTPDPSCSDGRQNQGETGVDCGTVCGVLCGAERKPLVIGEPQLFQAGEGIDIIVELENDNTIFGAARVDWSMTVGVFGSDEEVFRRGNTYVNPLETRFLVMAFPGISSDEAILNFEIETQRVQWFSGRLPESSVVDFSVMNETLVNNDDGSVRYTADVRNDSTFDFDEVDVTVIILDASGQRLGVASTVVKTLVSGQVRAFTVDWPFEVSGRAFRAQVEVSTNVFDNANFIRTYGGQEQFQQF